MSTFTEQEQFKVERQQFLGGSDTASLFNLEPYGCALRLYNQKTGVEPDLPFYGSRATDRGTRLEHFAGEIYAAETKRDIRRCPPKAYAQYPWFRPQPDFEIVNNPRGMGPGILSIKVPGREIFKRMKRAILDMTKPQENRTELDEKMAAEGQRVLFPYFLQLQSEITCYQRTWGSFGFYWADGDEVAYIDYDYDAELSHQILERAAQFWSDKEQGIAPAKLDPKSTQCKRCEYRVSCQADYFDELLADENDSPVPRVPGIDVLVQELEERQDLSKEAEGLVDETKNKLRMLLTDSDAGVEDLYRVYNRLQDGKKSVNREPLLKYLTDVEVQIERLLKSVSQQEDSGPITLPGEALLVLTDLKAIASTVEKKFVKKGAAFRTLRHYALPKRKEGSNGTNQLG